MLRKLAIDESTKKVEVLGISHYCVDRIKPTMLSGVKTEALLVFARTALERYFTHIDELKYTPKVGSDKDTKLIYDTLKKLNTDLQKYVVNADYLISLVQGAKVNVEVKKLAKLEEPLMNYYDSMAHKVSSHYQQRSAYLPEFLVICVLSHWIVEEEKSVILYPFLNTIDFESLINIFEMNREEFKKDDVCVVSDILGVSGEIIKKLKNSTYKINKGRVSKTRKKK